MVTLTLSPSSRQRLQGVPGQWQLGRPRELLRVPGDPQWGGEAAGVHGGSGRSSGLGPLHGRPASWLRAAIPKGV